MAKVNKVTEKDLFEEIADGYMAWVAEIEREMDLLDEWMAAEGMLEPDAIINRKVLDLERDIWTLTNK